MPKTLLNIIDSFQVDIPYMMYRKVSNMRFWNVKFKKTIVPTIQEKHFILSFIQMNEDKKKEDKAEAVEEEALQPYLGKLKEVLKEKGLEIWHKKESRQRIITFMILDDGGKGIVTYQQFWQMMNLADI